MVIQDFVHFLKDINRLSLVSGYEDHHLDQWKAMVESFLGQDKRVQVIDRNLVYQGDTDYAFSAHYDEIGYVVDNAYRKDLYRLIPIGLNTHERAYGKILRTLYGKEIKGVATAPMPHLEVEEKRAFVELYEEHEIPPLYPFTFDSIVIETKDKIFSRAIDDRIGVFLVLYLAREYDISFVLWAGEELGTTRVFNVVNRFKFFIEIDTIFSENDVYAPYGLEDTELGYIAVEGGGKGNIAPPCLVNLARKIATEIKTTSPYEITDATTIYRFGGKAIAIMVPIYDLHSSLEMIRKETVESAWKKLEQLYQSIESEA